MPLYEPLLREKQQTLNRGESLTRDDNILVIFRLCSYIDVICDIYLIDNTSIFQSLKQASVDR